MAAPGVSSLASDVNSLTPAVNGHHISAARWNSHYLFPSYQAVKNAAAGQATSPSTPDSFTPPNRVLVSRSQPSIQPNLGSGATALNNPASDNSNYVIGRYAYTTYDECGLLDMNVAGFPSVSPSPAPASTGFTSVQASCKNSLATADLTQLPIVRSSTSIDPTAAPNE